MATTENRITGASASPSILSRLRAITPRCQLTFNDTKAVAERHAALLVRMLGEYGYDMTLGVQELHLASMPRLRIVRETLPTAGLSYWNGHSWLIVLADDQPPARQRFTMLHEFKHILDHGAHGRLYRNDWQAERVADYFAGCVLLPKPALKKAFCSVTQDIARLAQHFGASQQAVQVRLVQIGLVDPPATFIRERCARPVSTPTWQEQRFRMVTTRRGYA
jgi:predicted transcriptional regulator